MSITPQFALGFYLILLVIMSGIGEALKQKDPAKAVGGFMGTILRYLTIYAITWWGGFWK